MAQQLGQYEVVREIGRGSMGVVYLGRDRASGNAVALKIMRLAQGLDEKVRGDARERFTREAKFLESLQHPSIVRFYSAGEEQGVAYIAMEFLHGVDLTRHTHPRRLLPLPITLEIMARAAEGLGYAHERGIVHHDVKPGNIMYDAASNIAKVADFGISRLSSVARTQPGPLLGSPLYMSPEQVVGEPICGQSDLFSLGTTLYQLASGRLPFEGETDMSVMYHIAMKPHTDIASFRPDLPAPLCAIIDRALAKGLAQRYQSGHQIAHDLRQCAARL